MQGTHHRYLEVSYLYQVCPSQKSIQISNTLSTFQSFVDSYFETQHGNLTLLPLVPTHSIMSTVW